MEKLQAALEKARGTRQAAVSGASGQTRVQAKNTTQVDSDDRMLDGDAWNTVPYMSEVSGKHLLAHHIVTYTANERSEPFDVLRTKILLQMEQNGWKRLAITSPTSRCGKSTMACNLTMSLSRQLDMRSILLDFDLGSPSIQKMLNFTSERRIGDWLNGRCEFSEHAKRLNDHTIVAGSSDPEDDPTRLLLSSSLEDHLSEMEREFKPDITIFDMPAMLVGDNTRAFLRNVDCALIVARAGQTKYQHLDQCEREVAAYTNIIGVTLNAAREYDE